MARIINVPTEIPDVNPAAEAALKDTHNPFAQFDEKRGFPWTTTSKQSSPEHITPHVP